jgi:hypothetical protein
MTVAARQSNGLEGLSKTFFVNAVPFARKMRVTNQTDIERAQLQAVGMQSANRATATGMGGPNRLVTRLFEEAGLDGLKQ